jgi:hypothetical protein
MIASASFGELFVFSLVCFAILYLLGVGLEWLAALVVVLRGGR